MYSPTPAQTLRTFTDDWQKQMSRAMQPQVDAGSGSRKRATPTVRGCACSFATSLPESTFPSTSAAFIGTVWADYLTRLRQAEGTRSDAYAAAVKTMDDMLWSITAKGRTASKGQRYRR